MAKYLPSVIVAIVFLLPTYPLQAQRSTLRTPAVPNEITYTQVYVTPDGETHFREVSVPLTELATAPPSAPVAQSALQPGTTIRHAVFPANYGTDDRDRAVFHAASARRFVTIRSGTMWVKVSDGQTRRFQVGDLFEVLDIAPAKGHITWVGDEQVVALFSNHP